MGHPSIHRPYIPMKKSNKIMGSVFGGMQGMLITKCKKSLWGILEEYFCSAFQNGMPFYETQHVVFYLFFK
jgi:hypothetical protein